MGIMDPHDLPCEVGVAELRLAPQGGIGQLQQIEQMGTLQVLHRAVHQARDRRVGKADDTLGVDHQDAFGGIFQDRGVERPGSLQLAGQLLQHAPAALLVQLRLHLGLENLWIERFEQVIHRATGVALEHGGIGLLVGSEEDNRGQPGSLAAAHQAGDLEAVHFRHLHIEQYQIDFVFQQRPQGFHPRACSQHLPIVARQQGAHTDQVFRVIVYHQENRFAIQWFGVSAIHAASLV